MWEEDPRFQNAQFRFVIGSVVTITVLAASLSVVFWDWEFIKYWFGTLGVAVIVVGLYGVAVWLVGHGLRSVARILRRLLCRGGRDA
jgi:hypothetical protein